MQMIEFFDEASLVEGVDLVEFLTLLFFLLWLGIPSRGEHESHGTGPSRNTRTMCRFLTYIPCYNATVDAVAVVHG